MERRGGAKEEEDGEEEGGGRRREAPSREEDARGRRGVREDRRADIGRARISEICI